MVNRPLPAPLALGLLSASLLGCPEKPRVDKESPPPALSASAAAAPRPSAGASAGAAPTPGLIPTYTAERFAPDGAKLTAMFAVEGGIAVVEDRRVGVIQGEKVTWVGEIPAGGVALGPTIVTEVHGRFPDLLSAVYTTSNGRALQPTYYPLSGKGETVTAGPGGGWGNITGVARVGETVIVGSDDNFNGTRITPIRGPRPVIHLHTPAEAGCKPGEVTQHHPARPAIVPSGLESTPAGTLISLGNLCEKRGPAAEIWGKGGEKPRIIELGQWWKLPWFWPTLLKGAGDELWAYADPWSPVLHYKDGEFSVVPQPGPPIQGIFGSPQGVLHATDGKVVFRFEGGAWAAMGYLPTAPAIGRLALDEQGTLWSGEGGTFSSRAPTLGVDRLRPGPGTPPPAACATPFVYLYRASDKNGPKFTYPSTRKALSAFPEASALGLVEFGAEYARHVGVTAATAAQAEALIAHIKATMKDEDPRYFCFAPKDPRKIPLDAK